MTFRCAPAHGICVQILELLERDQRRTPSTPVGTAVSLFDQREGASSKRGIHQARGSCISVYFHPPTLLRRCEARKRTSSRTDTRKPHTNRGGRVVATSQGASTTTNGHRLARHGPNLSAPPASVATDLPEPMGDSHFRSPPVTPLEAFWIHCCRVREGLVRLPVEVGGLVGREPGCRRP